MHNELKLEDQQQQRFTFTGQFRAIILGSRINILLIMSPVGIAAYYTHINPIAVFVINFIALIPLTSMLSYATKEIALRTDEAIGSLLNTLFGHATELIILIIALTQSQLLNVKIHLTGSLLSNALFVLGMCSFLGCLYLIGQDVNTTVARTAFGLLFLAVAALFILMASRNVSPTLSTADTKVTAISLLVVYACYLFFLLKSHPKIYQAPSEKKKKLINDEEENTSDIPEIPQLSKAVAAVTLLISAVLVVLNAEYFVGSIKLITWGSYGWMDIPLSVAGGSIMQLVLLKSRENNGGGRRQES